MNEFSRPDHDPKQPLDPSLTPEALADLAGTNPELWDEIAAHPNAYPALRDWIGEQTGFQAPASFSVMPGSTAHWAGSTKALPAQKKRAVIAAVVAGALIIGGAGAAFAWGGLFGGSKGSDGGSGGNAKSVAFAQPPELLWEGQTQATSVIQIDGAIVTAAYGESFSVADAVTGETVWQDDSEISPNGGKTWCELGSTSETALCVVSYSPWSEIITLDKTGEIGRLRVDSSVDRVVADPSGYSLVVSRNDSWGNPNPSRLIHVTAGGQEDWAAENWGTPAEARVPGTACDAMVTKKKVLAFGPGCLESQDVPGKSYELVSTEQQADAFAVSGGNKAKPFWLFTDGTTTTAFSTEDGGELWQANDDELRLLDSWQRSGGAGAHINQSEVTAHRLDDESVLLPSGVVVSQKTGEVLRDYGGLPTPEDRVRWTLAMGAAIGIAGDTGDTVAYDARNETRLWEAQLAPALSMAGGEAGVALAGTDDTITLQSTGVRMYGPGVPGSDDTVQAVSIPSFIPGDCPSGTFVLAWTELQDGWLLICGKPIAEGDTDAAPTVMMAQLSGEKKPRETTDVSWDPTLGQFRGVFGNGEVITLDGEAGTVARHEVGHPVATAHERFVRTLIVPLWGAKKVRGFVDGAEETWQVKATELTKEAGARFPVPADRRLDESWADATVLISGAVVTEVHYDGGQRVVLLDSKTGGERWSDGVEGSERDYSTIQCSAWQERAYCLLTENKSSEIVVLDADGERDRFAVQHGVANIAADERGLALIGYDAEGTVLRLDHSGAQLWESEPIPRASGVITGIDVVEGTVLVRTTGGWEALNDHSGSRLAGFAYPEARSSDSPIGACEARLTTEALEVSGPGCPQAPEAARGVFGATAEAGEIVIRDPQNALSWYINAGAKSWAGPDGIAEQVGSDELRFFGAK